MYSANNPGLRLAYLIWLEPLINGFDFTGEGNWTDFSTQKSHVVLYKSVSEKLNINPNKNCIPHLLKIKIETSIILKSTSYHKVI